MIYDFTFSTIMSDALVFPIYIFPDPFPEAPAGEVIDIVGGSSDSSTIFIQGGSA